MHNTQTQDTSTQAMTEVALGLSMAFFAILIVALLSMGLPAKDKTQATLENNAGVPEFIQLQNSKNDNEQKVQNAHANKQFILFYNEQFLDQHQQQISLLDIDKTKPLVLAVSPKLPLSALILLKQDINHSNFSITTLDKAWLTRLESTK